MSYRDISSHIKEMYDTDISHTVLGQITDKIIPDVKAWQNRPLEPLNCIVWLDAMHYKVKVDGRGQIVGPGRKMGRQIPRGHRKLAA